VSTAGRTRAGEVEDVASWSSRRLGIDFGRLRREELLRRVSCLMERRGAADADEYIDLLDRDEAAFQELVDEVTVGETYFFREPGHFDVLRHQILPELGGRSSSGLLWVWSAGCANGAEAYSLAIVLTEHGNVRFRVLGTDVAASALKVAASGTYSGWALRTLDERTREKYFEAGQGGYRLRRRLARHVVFRPLNLLAEDEREVQLAPMDVVFCRNVLIYFTADAVATAARILAGALAPGGWLVTAASDPPLGHLPELQTVRTPAGIVYRRRPEAADADVAAERQPAAEPTSRPPMSSRRQLSPIAPISVRQAAQPAKDPDPLEAARSALDGGDYGLAEMLAGALAQRGEGGSEAYAITVRALANRGLVEEALRCCEAATARFPLVAELRYLHCLALLEVGRVPEAADAARAAVYLRPDLAVAHLALGRAETSLGRPDLADRSLRTASQLLRALPEDQPVALADGETAGRLIASLEASERLPAGPRSGRSR
jgi:chemotaxis protein methyltransferase CheR